VIRPDRLGDVILSTPVFEALKEKFSDAEITALVQANVRPLLDGLSHLDHVWEYDATGGLQGLSVLTSKLREGSFDIAVVLQSNWKIAVAVFLAGIPVRIGPLSKPHSYLFYNRGLRQHRSRVECHEAEYNLGLLESLGITVAKRKFPVRVFLAEETRASARTWLTEKGWNPDAPLIAVHPGMGGSALNWPEEYYLELVKRLAESDKQILVTGGPSEGSILEKYKNLSSGKIITYGGKETRDLSFLAGLFSAAHVVVAPSTGPLHVAVAVGCRVVTFYPPIRVQSAKRWGPYVQDPGRASIFVPAVRCEETFACPKALCKSDPCMRSLSVENAFNEVERQLAAPRP